MSYSKSYWKIWISRPGNKELHRKYCTRRRLEFQRKLNEIKLKKGCKTCNYRKNSEALCFHHKNSNTKSFALGLSNGASSKRVEKEIKKCQVLCLNCHAELHSVLKSRSLIN